MPLLTPIEWLKAITALVLIASTALFSLTAIICYVIGYYGPAERAFYVAVGTVFTVAFIELTIALRRYQIAKQAKKDRY